ncbi:MAG: zinc-binding dehydrogenase [Microbacterium sp.]|uniref:zinc-binding dehydrogenase n=1 Tax=Microbacterium sp. TaxID=51671 RepID=UPI0039E618A7
MKALMKVALDGDGVEIREFPAPEPDPWRVVVDTAAVGVCGSDIHLWRNKHSWEVSLPVVMGHEIAGVVSHVGANVVGWHVGDRVVCETASQVCGVCAYCRSGAYNLCPERLGYGAKNHGFFTEQVSVEPRILHRIPDAVPFEAAAMCEPFAVAFNALVERATVTPGDVVVVQGVGAIGVLCAQIAKLQGASTVVALHTDNDERRLAAARRLGVDLFVNIQRDDPESVVRGIGDGNGAHIVVDATGVSAAFSDSMRLVRPLGSIVKVGWGPQPLEASLDPLVAKAVTVYGCFSHTWETWERVLDLMARGRLEVDAALGGLYPLDAWLTAFEDMESGRNVKSVIRFSPTDAS